MEVNFFGIVRVTKSVLPLLKKIRGSRVINVTSLAGLIPVRRKQGVVVLMVLMVLRVVVVVVVVVIVIVIDGQWARSNRRRRRRRRRKGTYVAQLFPE